MHNLLPAEWVSPGIVQTDIGRLQVLGSGQGSLSILIRPEAASVGQTDTGTVIGAKLIGRSFRGTLNHITVKCASGRSLAFILPANVKLPPLDQQIVLSLDPTGLVCLKDKPAEASLSTSFEPTN
jgi:hypothetical protein